MSRNIYAPLLLCLLLFAAIPFYGQQKGNTLQQLWPEVAKNYPGIFVKDAAIKATIYNEKAVKSDALPQAKLQAQNSYGTFEGRGGAFFPQPGFFNVSGNNTLSRETSSTSNVFASGTVEWEIFAFGKQHKRNSAASAQTKKANIDKESYILQLKKELSLRFINLLYNDAQLNWSNKNTERLNDIRIVTQGLARAGLKPAADSLLALSSYIQAKAEIDKWQGNKKAAFARLAELYGSKEIAYSDSATRFIDGGSEFLGNPSSINNNHPFLESLTIEVEINKLKGEAIQRAGLPSLKLLGGYSYRGTGIYADGYVSDKWGDAFSNTAENYLVGVGVVWNLTGLFTNKLKKQSYYQQAEETNFRHSQYELQMEAELEANISQIEEKSKLLQKTAQAVAHSQDAYNMYLARYKSGLITLSELLQIQLLLEQAESKHIEGAHDYWMQLANLAELTTDFDHLFNNL